VSVSIEPQTQPADRPDWEQMPDGAMSSVRIGAVSLDNGQRLDDVTLAFQRWGTLSPTRDNVILTLHALTGDSHVTGPADDEHPTAGWWDGLIGPGLAIDTDEWCVISANVLGGCRGSTGPASPAPDGRPWGSRFPQITVLDQVRAERILMEHLGITGIGSVVGGSMGGARALEWAIEYPEMVRSALVLAVGARATADQIGTQTTQIAAIQADPAWQNGDYHRTGRAPTAGLGVARRIAHLTYRGEVELDRRFANHPQADEHPLHGGRYSADSYLQHQADKLTQRFDAGSYVVLSEVLNHHDVGRNRGRVEDVLGACQVPVIVGGIASDRLYPIRLQEELAEQLGNCVGGLQVLHSDNGHDGFLTEFDAISDLLKRTAEIARA
jgi:homoserine O-acetyltransferase